MKISLVICTRDRGRQLAKALDSLLALQSPGDWEVVLVDNGSSDETPSVIENFKARAPFPVVPATEQHQGLGAARNRGWNAARGKIVAFTDDDCYPAEDFLVAILRCFDEDPPLGYLGGRVLLYDPTDYRITIQEQATRQALPPLQFIPCGLIHGANFAFRREALKSVDGFDDRFGAGTRFACGEDVDVVARLSASGWPGAYDPRPTVHHHHGRKSLEQVRRLVRQYDRGRGAFYAKSILDRRLRGIYFEQWTAAVRQQPRGTTVREMLSAAEFLLCAAVTRLKR